MSKLFEETFSNALEKHIRIMIQKWSEEECEKILAQYQLDLKRKLIELSARASLEIFNIIEMYYEKNRLVISIKQEDAK